MAWKTNLLALLLGQVGFIAAAEPDFSQTRKLFTEHCIACHGPAKQKADVRLDTLAWETGSADNFELWQTVYDQLEAEAMPPEDVRQPTGELRVAALSEIKSNLAKSSLKAKPVVLRRLNRSQYRNAIRDLLKIDVVLTDPTAKFPSDEEHEGFDVIGETLIMSDFLMRKQLEAARDAVALASYPETKPESTTVRAWDTNKTAPDLFGTKKRYSQNQQLFLWLNGHRNPTDTRGQMAMTGEGVDHKGWYDFEIEVESRGRSTTMLSDIKTLDRYHKYHGEDLHCLEIYLLGSDDRRAKMRQLLERIDLPDNKRGTIKRRIWLDKGWRLGLAFGNGPYISDGAYAQAIGIDPELLETSKNATKQQKVAFRKEIPRMVYRQIAKVDAPRIVIHGGSRTGPVFDTYPPESHTIVNGKPDESQNDVIRRFAARAFRRPVKDVDLEPYFKLAQSSPNAARDAIAAMLCAPDFIYFNESEGLLDAHALATRLSFFLTHTIPDAELAARADDGTLLQESVLRQQANRLLASKASKAFAEDFVWSWLKLQNTRQMAPGFDDFTEYHVEDIAGAMVTETNLFFRYLIYKNAEVQNLIDSNFTYLNAKLARYYGVGSVETMSRFQRVTLKPQDRRGGLLGQASVLTASADGVETSPVTRGIWILENIMGTPPAPPPPGLETALAPDLRNATTIRERLKAHREKQSCNECHKSIDPIGFALESFDPTGFRREQYASGEPVDTAGNMPDGAKFEDERGLKKIFLGDLTLVRRNLISKLLTYATGRTMEVADRAEIDRIAGVVQAKGDGVRDLIVEAICSDIFRTK